jgi:hypothetical protein
MSWKPEVFVEGKWCNNGLVFQTREEAKDNAYALMERWILVEESRAVESDEKPNYRWIDGHLEAIK